MIPELSILSNRDREAIAALEKQQRIEVIYGTKILIPERSVRVELVKPRIPYVGAIMDFLTHSLIWYSGWISLAIYVFTRVN